MTDNSKSTSIDPLTTTRDFAAMSPNSAAATPDALAIASDFSPTGIAKVPSTSAPTTSISTTAIIDRPITIDTSASLSSSSTAAIMDPPTTKPSTTIVTIVDTPAISSTRHTTEEEASPQPSIGAAADTAITATPIITCNASLAIPLDASACSTINALEEPALLVESLETADVALSPRLTKIAIKQSEIATSNTKVIDAVGRASLSLSKIKASTQKTRSRNDQIGNRSGSNHNRKRFISQSVITILNSPADSDQSGDYGSMTVGEKRTFKDFVSDKLDDSN
ncbi:hypothetical protein B0J14DRAFT_667468 [Halenospora varia]|nr:hypothetical protein B0J14DRAFT_667468 [Halenospora varia]